MANPILAAVPQIRRTLRHPDPPALPGQPARPDRVPETQRALAPRSPTTRVSAAVYALCALLDESAAATPWGQNWIEQRLCCKAMRGESGGGEGFFTQLRAGSRRQSPSKNADLLEFF